MRKKPAVLIAGAGPVGLVAAANLVRNAVPVTVLEAGSALSVESRASTFHPPTLDMLDELGAAAPLIAQGRRAPRLQFRSRAGKIAEFDFALIADATRHPYRLQSEQFKLTRILYEQLRSNPDFSIRFGTRVERVQQDSSGVRVYALQEGKQTSFEADWVIGADGASSAVRTSLGIGFDGFTWPERFLVVSTPFDFRSLMPDLASVSYVADPVQWHFYLQIPEVWRIMFPVPQEITDEVAKTGSYALQLMDSLVPGVEGYEIVHTTLYRVHQRVASRFRLGRALLAGDAAHINNPLGGMGMNGGIHDAMSLTERLVKVCRGEAPESEMDRYERQRRAVTLEAIQKQTIQNKANLEAKDPAAHEQFKQRMRETAADQGKAREYLLNASMIASLRRAAELA